MSHKKLREEKNCLNCGHIVEERFCTHCGQENLEIHDSTFHLIIHYIQDMFHYDGKFWHTLKMLILKPGLVAKEYLEGKRSQNLEPLRFYVFASTVFFLLLFYMASNANWQTRIAPQFNYKKRLYNLDQERKYLAGSPDTAYVVLLRKNLKGRLDSLNKSEGDSTGGNLLLDLSLPESEDTSNSGWLGNWIERRANERTKELAEKHEGDEVGAATDILSEAFHKLPQLLFLSMPFFAFFLKLLYIRKRHNYVEHLIFSIYLFAYLFVIMSVIMILNYRNYSSPIIQNGTSYAIGGLILYLLIYLLLAMKRFYNDRWRYVILRYLLLLSLFLFLLMILFLINVFLTYMW
jgi:Protein of unknown function (DUF3667)